LPEQGAPDLLLLPAQRTAPVMIYHRSSTHMEKQSTKHKAQVMTIIVIENVSHPKPLPAQDVQ